ncbi:ATP synthase F0 subunit B [Parabacteroides sp. 52]|uniref:F0F1 ATP synthase subunit B n=1 Tax=unclassified Parabacteroides TaxID=2649774 RepID=UPI0013D72A32|nr:MULTISPECIES: F0F1 ATP synthase subunit B [unclassified Parabacteroides]MDH6535463.1 F-type H+-transporting ATPase subunit b [Parabacteroides sp. PM5-20]NDV55957.1 ATP synthase F0 subunit B [Parabacteroides sp. 52]
MSLLIPDSGLLFWMTLSFGIVFFILAKFAFPVILKAVDQRNAYIKDSLQSAHEAEEKLAALHLQAEAILEKAQDERKTILHEAQETKKRIESEALQTAETEARMRLERAMAEIEESKRKALVEVRDQIVDISVKIAGKVVSEDLTRDKKQKELIDRLLQEEIIYKS